MTTKRLDSRDGQVYVLPRTDPLWLAVRIAKTTGRPLLLRGDPGTGKSSLAAKVALDEKWRYYEHNITPRTDGTDLLWTFDAAGKAARAPSNDAGSLDDYEFVEPAFAVIDNKLILSSREDFLLEILKTLKDSTCPGKRAEMMAPRLVCRKVSDPPQRTAITKQSG